MTQVYVVSPSKDVQLFWHSVEKPSFFLGFLLHLLTNNSHSCVGLSLDFLFSFIDLFFCSSTSSSVLMTAAIQIASLSTERFLSLFSFNIIFSRTSLFSNISSQCCKFPSQLRLPESHVFLLNCLFLSMCFLISEIPSLSLTFTFFLENYFSHYLKVVLLGTNSHRFPLIEILLFILHF